MIRSLVRVLIGGALVVVVLVAGFSAGYEVQPGREVLLLRGGKVVASGLSPGLHWKIPLLESVVRLDERTQLISDRAAIDPADNGSGQMTVGYSILWKITDPEKYYSATGGGKQVVAARLTEAVERSLRDAVADSPLKFLERPAGEVESALGKAAVPAAGRLGVMVLGVRLGAVQLPSGLQEAVTQRMTAATEAETGSLEQQTRDAVAGIESSAAQQRASIAGAASRAALQVRAEGQRKVAAIYAEAARSAPDFFDFYHSLQSEKAQLIDNTRVLVISAGSPWFKELNAAGGGH